MPSGGRRAGAGRKPNGTRVAGVVLGMDGARRSRSEELPPAVTVEERASLLEPPSDLWEAAKPCWSRLAPKALEERTLTLATEAGFRELCSRMAYVEAIDARIALLGVATQDALPYLKERRGQGAQLAVSLKDFKLTAFGKPVTSDKPKQAANPWASIAPASGEK